MLTNGDIAKLKAVFATKDDLVSFKDEILKQFQDLRDDVAIVTGYRDTIEEHDIDIEAIKKHLKLSTP